MQEHRTWIELSTNALWHNIATMHALCGDALLGIVIKANAYGHGMLAIAQLLEQHPLVSWLFVAGTSEAVILRKAGIQKPILALSYTDSDLTEALAHDVACALYTIEDLMVIRDAARIAACKARIHIKIDSAMSRLGFMPDEVPDVIAQANTMPELCIEGLFTHLSDTNNPDLTFTFEQLRYFDAVLAATTAYQIPHTHVLASGSVVLEKKYSLVRVGTNIYGFWKSAIQKQRFEALIPAITLQPVLTWKARIIQIKQIRAGSFVGYNRTFHAIQPMKIAIVAVGYFDGYPRDISNKGQVMVCGVLAPVIGMVSMNMTIIDVTHIATITAHDEVTLLGNFPGITATDIATLVGTINNELVARIHEHIPRILIHDRKET